MLLVPGPQLQFYRRKEQKGVQSRNDKPSVSWCWSRSEWASSSPARAYTISQPSYTSDSGRLGGPRKEERASLGTWRSCLYCEVGDLAASNIFFRPSMPDMASTFFLQSPTSTGRSCKQVTTHQRLPGLEVQQGAPPRLKRNWMVENQCPQNNKKSQHPCLASKDSAIQGDKTWVKTWEEGGCVDGVFWVTGPDLTPMHCRPTSPPHPTTLSYLTLCSSGTPPPRSLSLLIFISSAFHPDHFFSLCSFLGQRLCSQHSSSPGLSILGTYTMRLANSGGFVAKQVTELSSLISMLTCPYSHEQLCPFPVVTRAVVAPISLSLHLLFTLGTRFLFYSSVWLSLCPVSTSDWK
jgi:hypothetical protein